MSAEVIKRQPLQHLISELLDVKDMTVTQMADALSRSDSDVRTAVRRMEEAGRVARQGFSRNENNNGRIGVLFHNTKGASHAQAV